MKNEHVLSGLVRKRAEEASITMKLKRGTFAASFLCACVAALEMDAVRLDEI